MLEILREVAVGVDSAIAPLQAPNSPQVAILKGVKPIFVLVAEVLRLLILPNNQFFGTTNALFFVIDNSSRRELRMESKTDRFMQYIQPHWRVLHIVARQYAVSQADSSDLVQETLLKAWKSFSSAEEKEYRRAWLFVIMRNVALDWQKMSKHRIKFSFVPHSELTEIAASDLNEPFCQMPVMDEEWFLQFVDDRIVAALDAIDPAFREVIILSAAGGLKYSEIAQVLDCPMGTVMSRMARARRRLREYLADFAIKPKKRVGEVERK